MATVDGSARAAKGWHTRRAKGTHQAVAPEDVPEVVRLYRKERLSIAAIADRLYYGRTAVRNALVREGVPIRPRGGRPGEVRVSDEEVEEVARLYEEGLTIAQVAGRMGRTYSWVQRRLANHAGIPRRGVAGYDLSRLTEADLREAERLYVEEGLSLAQVGQRLGITVNAVLRRLKLAGVERRPQGRNTTPVPPGHRSESARRGWETRRARQAVQRDM